MNPFYVKSYRYRHSPGRAGDENGLKVLFAKRMGQSEYRTMLISERIFGFHDDGGLVVFLFFGIPHISAVGYCTSCTCRTPYIPLS